jgi:hypothetical protein
MATTNRNQGGLISAIFRRGREERLPQAAGGLTFTLVMSMVPLLAVSFALFARIAGAAREPGKRFASTCYKACCRPTSPGRCSSTWRSSRAMRAGSRWLGFARAAAVGPGDAHERGEHAEPHLAGEEAAPGAAPLAAVRLACCSPAR